MALTRKEIKQRYKERHPGRIAEQAAARRARDPQKFRDLSRKFYRENREKELERARVYREQNPDYWKAGEAARDRAKKRAASKLWHQRNPEKMAEYNRRRLQDPAFALSNRIRVRFRDSLRKNCKSKTTEELLGYTIAELRAHIEKQFLPGMTWQNMRQWHIDHIVPISSFVITSEDDPELRRAWALSNLRPLWAKANLTKGDKRTFLL
jgi:hypothetical protein